MGGILVLLHNSRAINIATIVLAAFAGLYGYNSILGGRGGLLRRIIVAVPAGVVSFVAAYVVDTATNFSLSGTLRPLLQIPGLTISSFTIGLFVALGSFATNLTSSNIYRDTKEYERESLVSTILYVVTVTLSYGLFTAVEVIAAVTAIVPQSHRPPLPTLAVIAVCAALVSGLLLVAPLGAIRRRVAENGQTDDVSLPTTFGVMLVGGCLLNVILTVALTIFLIARMGWAALLYFAAIGSAISAVQLIQRWVDTLSRDKLLYISLLLFLLAAGLQLYQAVAL